MKKYLFVLLTSACMLTACGRMVEKDYDKPLSSSSSSSSDSMAGTDSEASKETTEAQTTTAQATTVTTTKTSVKEPSSDIPESVIIETAEWVEVYDEITADELVLDANVDIALSDELLDTSELGEKTASVEFEYEGDLYFKEVTYEVVDTIDPLALNMGWSPYVKVDEPFDLSSIIGYVDNYDRSPELSYEGEVDTSSVGTYPITVTVTDSSGNSTSWDMSVLVLNDIPGPVDNNARVNFTDFVDNYYSEDVSFGIDVSAWQTNVNYDLVKEQGCEFVLMRMGYCYGEIKMDDYYRQNIENATAAGLDVGVYFYTTANTEEKAREQADWIIEQLDGRELDYPVAFDWEEWGSFQKYGMNIHDLNEIFEAFCDELEQHGYTGMLYSSKNFLNNFWQNRNGRTVWLAHYVDETDYEGDYAIWQASAYGRMDGIDGDVDMNIRYNDVPLF